MKIAKTISTLAEAVEYLTVHCGIKQNWAQAMVTEFYHYDSDTNLQRYDDTVEDAFAPCDVVQSEVDVIDMYKDWLTYGVTETADGITFDGELVYDLQGKYLKK